MIVLRKFQMSYLYFRKSLHKNYPWVQGAFDVHQKRDIVSFTFFKVLPILDVFRSGTVGEGILWLVVHEWRGDLGLGRGWGGEGNNINERQEKLLILLVLKKIEA